jgi:hypothetical protein
LPVLFVFLVAVLLIPEPEGLQSRFILIPNTAEFEEVNGNPLDFLTPTDTNPVTEGYPILVNKPGFSPKHYSPRCIDTYDQLSDIINQASSDYNVPPELMAAIITSESSWDDNSYRYEPLFQVGFIEGNPAWVDTTYWINDGPTIRDWFSWNPGRRSEMDKLTQSQLNLVAQTRLSASYGLMQVLYTSSIPYCDFRSQPEELYDINSNVQCGTRALRGILDEYDNDLVESVSAYNAGTSAWRTNAHNKMYTEKVIGLYHAYQQCPY